MTRPLPKPSKAAVRRKLERSAEGRSSRGLWERTCIKEGILTNTPHALWPVKFSEKGFETNLVTHPFPEPWSVLRRPLQREGSHPVPGKVV